MGYNRWTLKMNGVDLASDVMVRGGAMVSTGLWTFTPVRSNLTGTVTLTLTLLGNQSVTSAFTWDNFVLKGFVQQVPTAGTSQTLVAGRSYRYGFNGKEYDNEVYGDGNEQDYGMRIYDPRIGKFLSVDPLSKSYPELTPYQFASNRPVEGIDLDGLEFCKNGVSMFEMYKGEVKVRPENVSSVYKDVMGKPLFDAHGVGLALNGKINQGKGQTTIAPAGLNNLPTTPDSWTFAEKNDGIKGTPKDLWKSSKGQDYYVTRSGAGNLPHNGKIPNTVIGNLTIDKVGTVGDGIAEGQKYIKMFSDREIWLANAELCGQINVFDHAITAVDQILNPSQGGNFYGSGKSQVSRDQLINFVADGSLPHQNLFDAFNPDNVRRDLNIMYVGIQIIQNHSGERSFGRSFYSTGTQIDVSDETKGWYKTLIERLRMLEPKTDTKAYENLLNN